MSRGQSQPRTQDRRRALDMCHGKSQSEDVVIIDLDSDDSHTATIVDVSESSRKRLGDIDVMGMENKLQPVSITIISIDDDDEEDLSYGNDNETGTDSAEESDDDEDDCILRNLSRTFDGESLFSNNFCLNPDFESSSSESDNSDCESSSSEGDGSDCEILVGSQGNIREQWEKAALRKKMDVDVRCGQTGSEGEDSASGSSGDTQKDLEVENTAEHREAPTCSSSSNSDEEKVDMATSNATGVDITEHPFIDLDENDPIADSVQTAHLGSPWSKIESSSKPHFSHKEGGVCSRGKTPGKGLFDGIEVESEPGINCNGAGFREIPERPFESTEIGQIQFSYGRHSFKVKEEKVPMGSCSFHTQPCKKTCFNPKKASFVDKNNAVLNSHNLDELEITQDSALSWDEGEGIFRKPSLQRTRSPNDTDYNREYFEKKQQFFEELSLFNARLYDDIEIIDVEVNSEAKDEPMFCETFLDTTLSRDETKFNGTKTSHLEEDKPIYKEQSMSYVQRDEGNIKHGRNYCRSEEESVSEILRSSQPHDERNHLMPDQDQNDLMEKREKFKETDEHKRDAEEECASSQQQLHIQSEEAMRLRKRKESETLRLLDVERRQKQRVEEVREMKKKDEECINMKEHIRAEIRNKLDNLEMQFSDMASLLRSLDICVGGGLYPMPHEVHAAYKTALLRFHPDRASKSDLRQQVEAEEKFKLISRSKEKLLPASC